MKLECTCHGVSGSCTAKTCWRKVPSMEDIGKGIKAKYDESIKVSVQITKTEQPSLRSIGDDKVAVSTNHLVHLKKSIDFCQIEVNFTQNRKCVPASIKNSYSVVDGSNVENSYDINSNNNNNNNIHDIYIVDTTLPVCEDFCCSGEYSFERTVTEKSCNCGFVWCCDVTCDTCVTTTDVYYCNS